LWPFVVFSSPFHGVYCHIFFFSYWDFSFGEKERKAQGLAFGFNLLYGYLSQQQHFIANPPLPALFKKELARFHVFSQVP